MMDVADAQGGIAGDGKWVLCPWNNTRILHERESAGAQAPHIPHNDANGDTRRGKCVQQDILSGKKPVAHTKIHMQTTTQERGNLRCDQRISQHDSVSNHGVVSLDFGRDMVAGE